MRDYLTVAEVLSMHADLIERYGGSHGIRDPGLLEAALYRPQTGYYSDLIEEAAALWESLAQNHAFQNHAFQNHAFIDGNKNVLKSRLAADYTCVTLPVTNTRSCARHQKT